MREFLGEILASIRQNKLRTVLTGFSVSWGILMLIILLGAGNGLQNAVDDQFKSQNNNAITLYPGYTTMPHKGHAKGRRLKFKYNDMDEITKQIPEGENFAAEVYTNGEITYNNIYSTTSIYGMLPSNLELNNLTLQKGRFINDRDVIEARKTVVLEESLSDILFGKGVSPVGKRVIIDSLSYKVVGSVKRYWGSQNFYCYIPLSTTLNLYTNLKDGINSIRFEANNISTKQEDEAFLTTLRERLASIYDYNKNDRSAVWAYSSISSYLEAKTIFGSISLFIWIIGLGTLMAGVVGVSNIMLVTVKERTNEFGIRKSLGASPSSLVKMILTESIFITATFGYIGMFIGISIMEYINFLLQQEIENGTSTEISNVFKNPTLDISIVLTSTLVLVIAGTIAGYIPARRAAQLKTIDAMRYNK